MQSRRKLLQVLAGAALLPFCQSLRAQTSRKPQKAGGISRPGGQTKAMRLKVSENQRFLVHEDGTPFFYLGDTAWELLHRRDFLSFEYTGTTGPNGA